MIGDGRCFMSIATTVSILHVRPIDEGGGAENRSDAVVAVGLADVRPKPGSERAFHFSRSIPRFHLPGSGSSRIRAILFALRRDLSDCARVLRPW